MIIQCPADEAASLLIHAFLLYGTAKYAVKTPVIGSTALPGNLSLVIYVFRECEKGRIVAFEIVEVCGVDTVIPNNGTTIILLRVA